MTGTFRDSSEDVTDPTDWVNTKFPVVKDLDSLLRCQICKDFITSPALTTCGHIFCSICIRRAISESNKCPACLEETYESGLRKVLLLDGIVRWFTANRKGLMNNLEVNAENLPETEIIEDSQSDNGNGEYLKEPEELAECPICGNFMPLEDIQGSHIDKCLENQSTNKQHNNNNSHTNNTLAATSKISCFFNKSKPKRCNESLSPQTPTPIPSKASSKTQTKLQTQIQPDFISYKQRLANWDPSLSTHKLREKLANLNLPSNGTRTQMENRLKEYINLYNANLDSLHPVDDRILINRLKKWELLILTDKQNNKSQNTSSPISRNTPESDDASDKKRQKRERKNWIKKHNSQYTDLIQQAKTNMKKLKTVENKEREDDNGEEREVTTENDK